MAPFVIFALPRSRTYWLSRFLTIGDWQCGHDELLHCRSLDDVRSWLSQPCTGTVETLGAPFWRLLLKLAPDVRIVTVRRPIAEVAGSLARAGLTFDPAEMTRLLQRLDRKLDQIEKRIPGVLRVNYADLMRWETCARLFEHCLPYYHDQDRWAALARQNLQISLPMLRRYCEAYAPQLDKLAKVAKHRSLTTMIPEQAEIEGVTFQTEPFADFYRDAKGCFAEHLVQTEQAPDDHARKNLALFQAIDEVGGLQVITARSNGRMFGYLVSVVAPSLDSPDITSAEHTIFFASSAIRGLGMKLQREALKTLRERGVNNVIFRAGHRGSGPRLGTFYRRLGAEEFGQMYRLELN
jgi:GNAT superfamily N-acetyltransferase